MRKFVVFSGFLGSGKTSTMMALTQYFTDHHGKAAMISNDLGGQGLAEDHGGMYLLLSQGPDGASEYLL